MPAIIILGCLAHALPSPPPPHLTLPLYKSPLPPHSPPPTCLTFSHLLPSTIPTIPILFQLYSRYSQFTTTVSYLLNMAVSGFEGFEKRLELHFSGDDPLGLRRLSIDDLQQVLDAVQCSIVSAAGNNFFDAYVLSESSLFLYPDKIILKTCGTTQLLRSIPSLLRHAAGLCLRLRSCRYSRGSFIFPAAQPFPHTSFSDEVLFLDACLPATLRFRKASVMPSDTLAHSWHVYSAADDEYSVLPPSGSTIEVCMTKLDRSLARRFYRRKGDDRSGDAAGAEMTEMTEIGSINPQALVCGFAFEPCGYSMNGLDCDRYSTIHVTPEDGHSYASFECVAGMEVTDCLKKVVHVFRPGVVSVSVCKADGGDDEDRMWSAVANALEPLGLSCRHRAAEDFPGAGTVTYQTFTARRK